MKCTAHYIDYISSETDYSKTTNMLIISASRNQIYKTWDLQRPTPPLL